MFIRKLKKQIICNFDEPIVQTREGKIRGVLSDDTYVFRGIRYAEAGRFLMPERVKPWDGVKEAIVYGFVCPEIFTPVPHDQYTVPHYFGIQSEECQYLNIWTQSLEPSGKKPVMVWLHGGGFFSGSGVEHYAYDGENLSKSGDVVVVTLNHRLNVLGFLDLSKYGGQYKFSGNAGMADLVAALQWIRFNIAAFGGDPDNVMIFGQSGGGAEVAALLEIPAADGLFHKAGLQSGGMNNRGSIGPEMAQRAAEFVLQYLKIAPDHISEIETVPYEELSEAAEYASGQILKEFGSPMMWGPVADREYYMGHPYEAGFRKETKHIPIICGSVLGEFSNNFTSPRGTGSKNSWSEDYKMKMILEEFGEDADKIIEAFKKAYPEKNIADVLFMDRSSRKGSLDFAKLHSEFTNAGTYNFIFNLESPFNGGTLPWHNAEIPYVFHNAEYLEPSFIPGVTEGLQDMVSGAWVSFAYCGNPNHVGMPVWPSFRSDTAPTMIFDRITRLGLGHDASLLSELPDVPFNISGIIGKKKIRKEDVANVY